MPRDSGDDAYAELARMKREREEQALREQRAIDAEARREKREAEQKRKEAEQEAARETMFVEHLQLVFGDRRLDFSPELMGALRDLWTLALKTDAGPVRY